MPKSYCIEKHCKRIIRRGTRCDACRAARAAERDAQRGSPFQRGYNTEFYRNKELLMASHPFCAVCGSSENLEGDHDIPLSRGGTNSLANTVLLCRRDNRAKGAMTLAEYLEAL